VETEELYTTYKPLLFALAYRMLGSVMDAEDIVQEAFVSLEKKPLDHVQHVKAYLCKIVTNRCIDQLKSARQRRETYVGPWLPEPFVTDGDILGSGEDPVRQYEVKESLSTAYLLLLQQLSWTERAVFLLREALQFDYSEIAEIVGKSSANCRQIFHRAKRSISGNANQKVAARGKTTALVEQFITAILNGNVDKLMHVLSEDATLYTDGGGKVRAARRPIFGSERICRFFTGIVSTIPANFSYRLCLVNGGPGIAAYVGGDPFACLSFRFGNGTISDIYIVVNPEKLQHLNDTMGIRSVERET
jgi:RNA polymerase sigma-70 factor (TIGR02957 family)